MMPRLVRRSFAQRGALGLLQRCQVRVDFRLGYGFSLRWWGHSVNPDADPRESAQNPADGSTAR
jgi:hypothetical protein